MKNKPSFFQWFKQTFFEANTEKQDKKPNKLQYVLLLVVLGVIFMIMSNFFSHEDQSQEELPVINHTQVEESAFKNDSENKPEGIKEFENLYENQLKEALEQIAGVDDVTVMVNVKSTAEKVYEKNGTDQTQTTTEVDREGGKRQVEDRSVNKEVVIIQNGEQEKPLLVMTNKPVISGVLVVANGAQNIQVKTWIVEAVTRLLDVPSHRVSVLPKKTKGE